MNKAAFRESVHIGRSPEEVWRALTDLDHCSTWLGVQDIELETGGHLTHGSVLRFSARGAAHRSTVTGFAPERLLALTSTQGQVTAVYTYTLEATSSGTRLTLVAHCSTRGLWSLARPALQAMMAWTDRRQVHAIKELAES